MKDHACIGRCRKAKNRLDGQCCNCYRERYVRCEEETLNGFCSAFSLGEVYLLEGKVKV